MANRTLSSQRGADRSWSQYIISSSATEAMVDDLQNQQLVPSSDIIYDNKVDRPHDHSLSARPSGSPMSSPSGSVSSDQICLTPEVDSSRDRSTKTMMHNPEGLSTDNLTGDLTLPLLSGIDCQTTVASLKRPVAEEKEAIEHPNRKAPSPDDCESGNIEHEGPNVQIDDYFKGNIGDLKSQLISLDDLHLHGIELYLGMLSQPGYSPISQRQVDAEVKGIYAGLVMAEAKCIKIDAQKAARPEEPLSTEQWQALVVLHRTLLYQHHDLLMAIQHPSGSPALLDLATRYLMPMRIWKHGIHAFLDVLRHRRPESHEHMLAFIYMAYQMMSLFFETVPGLIDTWIEYLGDLARFRMAIEEDREVRTIWGGIAERWYVMAADRHPSVGRLYHHSGALVRPSLHKFYLYSRALTSVVPFLNTRESLKTLCSSVKTGEQGSKGRSQSAEAMIMCFHAGVFAGREPELTNRDCNAALALLKHESRNEIANYGVALAVTNIAALFGFGTPDNVYRQLFDLVLSRDVLDSHPSQRCACTSKISITPMLLGLEKLQQPQEAVHHFCYNSFNDIIRRTPSREPLIVFLPYLHIMLVFFTSLNKLKSRLDLDDESRIRLDGLFHASHVDPFALSRFLNLIAGAFSISSRPEAYANSDTFPRDGVPLFEDYMIRGLVWAQWYFATDWFANIEDDDGSRCLEDDSKEQHRAARVLYLGMILAQRSELLSYDRETKRFSGVQASNANDTLSAAESPCSVSACSGDDASIENDYIIVSED